MFRKFFKREMGKKGKIQSGAEGLTTEPTTSVNSDSSNSSHQNGYTKFNLSTPPKGPNAVCLKKAKKRMKEDGFGSYLKSYKKSNDRDSERDRDTTRMMIFLYGRGCFSGDEKAKRKSKILKMVEQRPGEEGPKDCLMLVLNADGDKEVTDSRLRKNNESILEYYFAQKGAFGFLKDMTKAKYFYRIQKRGNCFLQAPCLMAAYLAQKQGISEIEGPVDATKYIRHNFSDEKLYDYLVKDNGGSSKEMLHDVLRSLTGGNPESQPFSAKQMRKDQTFDLKYTVDLYGPALLSGFTVYHGFKDARSEQLGYFRFDKNSRNRGEFVDVPEKKQSDQAGEEEKGKEVPLQSFQNEASGNRELPAPAKIFHDSQSNGVVTGASKEDGDFRGKHAMVLIGGRIDPDTKTKWLFLQNWWDDMQFVEVSDNYLNACGGTLVFVTDELEMSENNKSKQCALNTSLMAESSYLERADNGRDAPSEIKERSTIHA